MKTKNGIPMLRRKTKEPWARGCTGKKRFESYEEADAALKKMIPKNHDPETLNKYVCPLCDGIHIGHSELRREIPLCSETFEERFGYCVSKELS